MQHSKSATQQLRRIAGALSMAFMAAVGMGPANAQIYDHVASPPNTAQDTTTMSRIIADIERQANAYAPTSGVPHKIYIIDQDMVNTHTGPGASYPSQKLAAYLNDRGLNLNSRDRSSLRFAMGGNYGPHRVIPQALHVSTTDNNSGVDNACIVTPETADLSSPSLIEKWVGRAGTHHLQTNIDPGPYKMAERVLWHETWHCLDRQFVQAYEHMDRNRGFDYALGIHRAEMFADVAATLTMASKGDVNIIQQTADLRAIHSRWNGPKLTLYYSPQYDSQYYGGVTYYATPAHDAVTAHIARVGINRVRAYSMADIERIATDITHQHALNSAQFRAITDYLSQGNTYKNTLTRKAGGGDRNAQRDLNTINTYIARTDLARTRMTYPTPKPVLELEDVAPPRIDEILKSTPHAEKQAVIRAITSSINQALGNGQTARHGVLRQLETWRHALHTNPANGAEFERKLYLANMMLVNGNLDGLLQRNQRTPANTAQPQI